MKYTNLASGASIEKTTQSLHEHNFEPLTVETRAEAMAKIQELIPAGVSVMNGASVTLEQIGFIDLLKSGKHGWNDLHAGILAEKDPEKQAVLRKQSVISDYYLGSVHALTETGELVIASNTGSQMPHIVYTSKNLIFVVGAQKIVQSVDEGLKRVGEYVVPLEDKHMQELYNAHTFWSKTVIFNKENPASGRKVWIIIVNESPGF